MSKRNPDSPWNPAYPIEITPTEYEQQVVSWLRATGNTLETFEVQPLRHLKGQGGDYEFDAIAKLSILKEQTSPSLLSARNTVVPLNVRKYWLYGPNLKMLVHTKQ